MTALTKISTRTYRPTAADQLFRPSKQARIAFLELHTAVLNAAWDAYNEFQISTAQIDAIEDLVNINPEAADIALASMLLERI